MRKLRLGIPAAGGLIVYGVSGAGGINKVGSGTLTIATTQNSSSGGLSISGGTVNVANGSSLGTDSSTVTLNGGLLSFGYTTLGTNVVTVNQPLVLGTSRRHGEHTAGATTFNGLISGSGGLTLTTDTTYLLTTSSSYALGGTNTYGGGTTVGGSVTLMTSGSAQALGTGNVTVQSGGALVLASASNLAAGRMVTLQGSTASQYASALVLSDPTTNPSAVVSAASTGGVVALGSYTYSTPLDFSSIGNGKLALGSGGTAVYSAATLGAGSDGVYRLGGGTTGGTLTINGATNVLTGNRSVTIGDYGVSQSGTITTGTTPISVSLPLANNYTGGTALNSGTLIIGSDQSLGSGTLTLGYAALQASGGPRTLANPLVINSAGGHLYLTGTNGFTFTGTLDLGGGAGQIYAGSAPATFTNVISDGLLTVVGGPVTLAAANTFSALTINSGTVYAASDASLGTAGSTLTLSAGTLSPLNSTLTVNRPVVIALGSGGSINTNGGEVIISGAVTGTAMRASRRTARGRWYSPTRTPRRR